MTFHLKLTRNVCNKSWELVGRYPPGVEAGHEAERGQNVGAVDQLERTLRGLQHCRYHSLVLERIQRASTVHHATANSQELCRTPKDAVLRAAIRV